MADRRKLQGEIERCLKKVAEGVETFEEIWKKVYNATNANQKEKYEADLKKEIKKLQRLRDQLKTWMSASDIKDKKNIQEARKRIEQQMERFKVVERETKTKAYSKEGLGAAQKLDPAQKEKDEINCWLTACINRLNIQLDKFESEIEAVNFSLKKKKSDKEKADRLEELKLQHGKHKYHINQLEALLRMLDNGTVEVEQIKKIKDDVEYYIECSGDPDFQENEFIYDDLNLEDLEDYLAKQQTSYQQSQLDLKLTSADDESSFISSTPTSASSTSPSHSPSLGNHSSENSTPLPKVANISETISSRNTSAMEIPSHAENSFSTESNVSVAELVNCQTVINSLSSTSSTITSSAVSNEQFKNAFEEDNLVFSKDKVFGDTVVAELQKLPESYQKDLLHNTRNHYVESVFSNHENIWSSTTSTNEELNNSVNTQPFKAQNPGNETSDVSTPSFTIPSLSNSAWTDTKLSYCNEPNKRDDFNNKSLPSKTDNQLFLVSETKNISVNSQDSSKVSQSNVDVTMPSSTVVSDNTALVSRKNPEQTSIGSSISNHIHNFFPSPSNKDLTTMHNTSKINSSDLFSEVTNNSSENHEIYINLSTIFGEIPPHSSPSNEEYLAILERSKEYLPLPLDSQKQRYPCVGCCPMTVPDYYNIYISNCNTKEFFQRLSTETLFFIFYFLQGTKAQYFAARALKIKSWRFHTMFMMWFQRHEEPQKITDEYEQGTYIYFDYERWAQRKKEGFTFEYRYLEDKDFS